MQTDQRIAIIGAGAAGLSAAYHLRRKGYRRITVFDRRSRVGGKCWTETHDGRVYERGALVVGNPYTCVRELIHAAGLKTVPFDPIRLFDTRYAGESVHLGFAGHRRPGRYAARLLATYLMHCRKLSRSGFAGLENTAIAAETMDTWLRKRHLLRLKSLLAPYYVGWGYGYLEHVGALYVFKLLDFYLRALVRERLLPNRGCSMGYIPEGYQRLWEIIAESCDLQLDVTIDSVRQTDAVAIETGARQRRFDALILACPLDNALRFLDAGPTEHRLFSKIKTIDFYTITAEAEGLPPDALVFVNTYLTPAKTGHMVSWYRRWPDSGIIVFYIIGGAGMSQDRLAATLQQDLIKGGASLRRVHGCDHWRYFPHVATADLANGFYSELEAMQGMDRTWYAGELLSFPTVEHVVAYSRHLVERHF
jgi:predicted NAD/FAD-binding protein